MRILALRIALFFVVAPSSQAQDAVASVFAPGDRDLGTVSVLTWHHGSPSQVEAAKRKELKFK